MTPELVQPVLLGIALLATLVALRGMGGRKRASNPVIRRLATIYRLIAALLLCRLAIALFSGLASSLVTVAMMVVAAWLPLAGLRFAEELVRRHAPRAAKLLALGGAVAFSALALTVGFFWSGPALIALAIFQALILLAMIAIVIGNRARLSQGERATADTFLIALAATIPLALTDFRAIAPDLPVRFGGFAMLLLVLATSRLVDGGDAPRKLVRDALLCLAGGGLAALASGGSLAATAFGAALAALALLVERFGRGRRGEGGLIAALARSEPGDTAALLASHPLLVNGRVVEGEALAGYPQATIAQLVQGHVIAENSADPEDRDAARDVLDSLAATHLVRLSRQPPRFLAVSAGSFAGQRLDDELMVLARLVDRGA